MRHHLLLIFTIGCSMNTAQSSIVNDTAPMQYVINIGNNVSEIINLTWPVNEGDFADSATIPKSAHILVRHGNAKVWESNSKLTIINQDKGKVSRVVLSPLKDTLSMEKILIELVSFTTCLDLQPKKLLMETVSKWSSENIQWSAFAKRSILLESYECEIYIEVKPSSKNDYWYISVEIARKRM